MVYSVVIELDFLLYDIISDRTMKTTVLRDVPVAFGRHMQTRACINLGYFENTIKKTEEKKKIVYSVEFFEPVMA